MTRTFDIGRVATLLVVFALGIWLATSGLFGEIAAYWDDIVYLTRQHVFLVAMSGGAAILIGVPIGVWLSRPSMERYAEQVMQVFNIGMGRGTVS